MPDRGIIVELLPIGSIIKNKSNPRVIKDKRFKALKKSIKGFPEMMHIRPIVIDNSNTILGGNMRFEACLDLGWSEIPIIKADTLTEDQKKEFILKDNISAGEWDMDKLANEWDKELLDLFGIDVPTILGADLTDDEVQEDNEKKFMEGIKNYHLQSGDLVEIGEHRLVCGDSTSANNYDKLFNGKQPFLMVTDPPYGTNYDPNWRLEAGITSPNQKRAVGIVNNDDRADWKDAIALFEGSVAYVWHGGLHSNITSQMLLDCGYELRAQIIWNKTTFTISRGTYHWKHEPCWFAVKKGHNAKYKGGRKQTTVWDIDRVHATQGNPEDGKTFHSTQKPIECMARPIVNHGDKKDLVYDPFLGSGTTMVAAEKNGRICYGIELDPSYCNIIIDRMLRLNPVLSIKVNGKEV